MEDEGVYSQALKMVLARRSASVKILASWSYMQQRRSSAMNRFSGTPSPKHPDGIQYGSLARRGFESLEANRVLHKCVVLPCCTRG